MTESGFTQIGQLIDKRLVKKLKPPSRIQERLIESAVTIRGGEADAIVYQHSVMCQIGLPYRDPGDQTRLWDRKQGSARLIIEAGRAMHPQVKDFVEIGLPWGPKPRLILAYLNAEALRTQSPVIEVEGSLTAFVRRLGLDTGGRSITLVKDQLARLSASRVTLGLMTAEDRAETINMPIVTAFDLWFPKNNDQRVLWPSTVRLSADYFESLCRHAVPLNEAAIGSLSHNAMALDIYAWLAQRLHRIPEGRPQFITWVALWDQFGQGYARIRKFRETFLHTLAVVKTQYPAARYTHNAGGMTLMQSAPPIAKRLMAVS